MRAVSTMQAARHGQSHGIGSIVPALVKIARTGHPEFETGKTRPTRKAWATRQDPLQPYKKIIDRWLWPDVFRGQQTSVSRAKGAIGRYQKALGDPLGVAELLVFYCERAAGFCQEVDHRDPAYLDALVQRFKQALHATGNVQGKTQSVFHTRLERVRSIGRRLRNGVGEDMDALLSEFESSTPEVFHGKGNR